MITINNKNVLILMSALVPTIGHANLIRFARNLPHVKTVNVILGQRTGEPSSSHERLTAFREAFPSSDVFFTLMNEDDQPASDDPDFWPWWARECRRYFPGVKFDLYVGSEKWGVKMAEALKIDFIPYDIDREILDISGTRVRTNIHDNWMFVMPEFRRFLKKTYTMFGQESVGKTTHGRNVREAFSRSKMDFIPEYARPYLETVGIELNEKKMQHIYMGQYAFQSNALQNLRCPLTIQDTDLYSTIGYYRIMGLRVPATLERLAEMTKSDLYFLMPDDVPFEKDPLRYGGNVRQSTTEFWRELMIEYELPYVAVPKGSLEMKDDFIIKHIKNDADRLHRIQNYVRP